MKTLNFAQAMSVKPEVVSQNLKRMKCIFDEIETVMGNQVIDDVWPTFRDIKFNPIKERIDECDENYDDFWERHAYVSN